MKKGAVILRLLNGRWATTWPVGEVFQRLHEGFDEWDSGPQGGGVSESDHHPLLGTLRWLSRHAGFPKSRLAKHAETLVLLAAAAQALENDLSGRPSFLVKSRDVARDAALRAHSERRKLAHFKCDNSAKV